MAQRVQQIPKGVVQQFFRQIKAEPTYFLNDFEQGLYPFLFAPAAVNFDQKVADNTQHNQGSDRNLDK